MDKKQRGFGIVEIILTVAVIGLFSFAGWFVYKANHGSSVTDATRTKTDQADCTKSGVIIVMFDGNVSKARQSEIIAQEKASIRYTYDQLNGYALNVSKGTEQDAVNRFKAYNEVTSANIDHCNSANSAQ